jgi:hypothetical protein
MCSSCLMAHGFVRRGSQIQHQKSQVRGSQPEKKRADSDIRVQYGCFWLDNGVLGVHHRL